VRFNPNSDGLLVKAGSQINVARTQGKAIMSQTDPANVGGWRRGRLAYRDAPINRIATDLGRLIGEPVAVSNGLQGRRFSGLVLIDKDRKLSMQRLEALLGVKAKHGPSGWILTD
jgi:transmembrane sensor